MKKQEVLTYTSFDIELGDNIKKINNQTLISLINPIDKLEDTFSDIKKISNIRNIDCNSVKFVFDALNDIKVIQAVGNVFFTDDNFKFLVDASKVRKVDLLVVKRNIYEVVIDILFNKIIRGTHLNNVLFIHYQLDTRYKKNGSICELSMKEIQLVNKINNHLKMIKDIIKERVPNIKIIEINEEIYLKDMNSRNIYIGEDTKISIAEKANKAIKDDHIFNNEKIHPSLNSIRYCFTKAKIKNRDKLLIVFSAFSQDIPKYNYINALSYVDCNKLFILDDYGHKGSYYLGLSGRLDIETSVVSLITKIMNENNILFKNVISIGTSKGGSAALYYGLKYNYGNVIVGSPQYKIGSYLCDLSIKTYAKDIFGEISLKNRIKYDNLIRLVSNSNSNIYLLTSEGDNQYKKILKEFENVSSELKIKLNITKCDINHHREIAKVFPEFLNDKLSKILKINKFKSYFINEVIKFLKDKKRYK